MKRSATAVCCALVCIASSISTVRGQAAPSVGVRWLRGNNQSIDELHETAPISRHVTNDESLARDSTFTQTSDLDDLRIEISGLAPGAVIDSVVLTSVTSNGQTRDTQTLPWSRGAGSTVRSAFARLVGDDIDRLAVGSEDRTLRVALGDQVRVVVTTSSGTIEDTIHVGRPSDESGPTAARFAKLRAIILRNTPRGPAVIGRDDASAVDIVRKQIEGASQIWLQCFVSFGTPESAEVVVVDPPPATLLAIADEDGLAAYGGGSIRFRANDTTVDIGPTEPGATPVATALMVAEALRRVGFRAQVTENPATELGAGRSADVLVRDSAGKLVALTAIDGKNVASDRRQTVTIGRVDLSDGLAEFNNMTASAGSLEERTLIKSLADGDPATIDIFVVNRFSFATRQGEAFIENGGGPISNVVILDRTGMRQQYTAFTLPHEIGHVLLNQPYHPDNVGPDAPWLLMDSDSNAGTVTGPKRLTWDECLRARAQSENTFPALLTARPASSNPTPATPPQSRHRR